MTSRTRHACTHSQLHGDAPTGALRWGFISWLQAEARQGCSPAGPRSITSPVTRLSPTTPTPPDRKALTCYNAHTMDWRGHPWTVSTTCAMWCRGTVPRSARGGVPARQSGIAAFRSWLRSRVHTFICHDLSHAPCETSPCLRRWKQVRHVRLHVPLLRRLHVGVPGPHGEQVIRHPVVGQVREARRPSIVQTDPAKAVASIVWQARVRSCRPFSAPPARHRGRSPRITCAPARGTRAGAHVPRPLGVGCNRTDGSDARRRTASPRREPR